MFQPFGHILLIALLLTGCQNISKENLSALHDETERLKQENTQLKAERLTLKQDRLSLQQSVDELNSQLTQEISENQVLIEQNTVSGVIKVTMQEDILFPSGSFEIDQEGAAGMLRKVISSLDGKNKLRIVGHTDSLPVAKKWRSKFSDNWDLSARRAGEVARFLIWGAGFLPENIEVVGRAHMEPIASNATEEGRALNRRIELFIKK